MTHCGVGREVRRKRDGGIDWEGKRGRREMGRKGGIRGSGDGRELGERENGGKEREGNGRGWDGAIGEGMGWDGAIGEGKGKG